MLLQRIWAASKSEDVHQILIEAPKRAADQFGIATTFAPTINGDNKIAGVFDRLGKKIVIANCFSLVSQRFTFAHELGHMMLHPGHIYFRDRELSEPSFLGGRPYYEIEADAFAAEFLMPQKYLEQVFIEKFGCPIDGTQPNFELARGVSIRRNVNGNSPKTWSPRELAQTFPLERAKAIAGASTYCNRNFLSLSRHFEVSATAMGIQLLETGLVS